MNKLYKLGLIFLISCQSLPESQLVQPRGDIKFMTVDPGHFHSALVQKNGYEGVDNTAEVFALDGKDLELHLEKIAQFNSRTENPTAWDLKVYRGEDYFEKMLKSGNGNTVVLAGNNQKKTDYILSSVKNGLNVYSDKPMAIDAEGFEKLKSAFQIANEKNLLLYDIMTERFEITTILQKELSQIPEVFGELEKGTLDNPSVTKESVHHFYKYVAGKPLVRPRWFFDVKQEGEGLVDVMTHLVDLVQWECYPEQIIDHKEDIKILSAKRWPTVLSLEEFQKVTQSNGFPEYFDNWLSNDSTLEVFCNGEIIYELKGVTAKTSVTWAYQAPPGTGDTHYSIMRGSKASLEIRQGKEQDFTPTLYILSSSNDENYKEIVTTYFQLIQEKYPEVALKEIVGGWEVIIPQSYRIGHEAHFTQVTQKFIEYYKNGNMPEWEVPNMIAKYYLTTRALEMALED